MRPTAQPEQAGTRTVYDLGGGEATSDAFYGTVNLFANLWLETIEKRAGDALDGYARFVTRRMAEAPRSRGEYAIEFLTLGMAFQRYEPATCVTPLWAVAMAHWLLAARRVRLIKPAVDAVRAVLHRYVFAPAIARAEGSAPGDAPLDRLTRLVSWLCATGEFEQEKRRLEIWRRYLGTLQNETAAQWISTAESLFEDFARDAEQVLGLWTRGVPDFLHGPYAQRGCREDRLFCGKTSAEYHLNMVAAEVMNRGLRPEFLRTRRRVVLIPACMRRKHASRCRAHVHGVDIACAACDPECTVNRLTQRLRKRDVEVYIVPHSTGFSRWLDRWEREPGVGVTAVACLLNILPGGYEMRARSIASQCVPLDFPGCRRHWNPNGIPTGIHEDRLVQIACAARSA